MKDNLRGVLVSSDMNRDNICEAEASEMFQEETLQFFCTVLIHLSRNLCPQMIDKIYPSSSSSEDSKSKDISQLLEQELDDMKDKSKAQLSKVKTNC